MNAELLSEIVEWTGEVSSIGYWSFDPESGHLSWSDQTFRILGYAPGTVVPTYELIRNTLRIDEREAFDAGVQTAQTQEKLYVIERAITTHSGIAKRIRVMGRMRRETDDQPALLVGMIQDISHERARQQTLGTALQWLETASEIARLGYWYLDVAHQTLEWSEEVYRIHGYEPGAFTPLLDMAIEAYHPDDRDRIAEAVRRGQESGDSWSLHARLLRSDGSQRQVMASGRPMYDEGRPVALFGVIQDVTAQQEQLANDRLFVSLVTKTPEGICITDADGACQWMNRSFERMSGFSQEEMHGQKPGLMLQGPETDPESVARISAALAAERSCTEEIMNYRKDGEPYWTRLSIFPHHDESGTLTHFMSIQVDVTSQKQAESQLAEQSRSLAESNFYLERQRAAAESMADKDRRMREELEQAVTRSRELQEELRQLAHYDELSGLPNRRYALRRAEAEHRRARRYCRPMSLIMADIDNFKSVNDRYGHQVGDQAICQVAYTFEELLRQSVDLCGRLGGEEFLLILPETNLASAIQVAERLRAALESTPFHEGPPIRCSFGVAEATQHANIEDAVKAADKKLYEAKEAGRNRVMY